MKKPAPTTAANPYPAPGERPPHHEYAKVFPMLGEKEMDELAQDIKGNGQREAIVLLDGHIIDGRNREEACHRAKRDPFYRFYDPRQDGNSPLSFVISRNLRRRQLTTSQAAIVAAEVLPLFEAEAKGRQAAAGSAHKGNLKLPVVPPPAESAPKPAEPAPSPSLGPVPEKPEEKVKPLEEWPANNLKAAAELCQEALASQGTVTVAKLQRKCQLGYTMASALYDALETAGKIGPAGVPVPPDDMDQRPEQPAAAPKPKKPAAPKPPKAAPAPVPPPPAAPATSREAAGAQFGVSGRSVQTAKNLLEKAPEAAAAVKAGKKSLNAAAKEAAMDSPEVQTAIGRITQVCGASLGNAVREGTRLKGAAEILEMAALEDERMLSIRGLIDGGWSVKKALEYKVGALSRTHKIADLLDRATANSGEFTLEVDGWRINVSRIATPAAVK